MTFPRGSRPTTSAGERSLTSCALVGMLQVLRNEDGVHDDHPRGATEQSSPTVAEGTDDQP